MSLQHRTHRLDPSFLHLLCLFLPRTHSGTRRPWEATDRVPLSAPNNNSCCKTPPGSGTRFYPMLGPSSQVLVASSSVGAVSSLPHSLPRR